MKKQRLFYVKIQRKVEKWCAYIILLLCIYVLAFQPVGFILDTIVFLFLEMLVLTPKEKRNLPLLGILSVATPFIIYTLFVYAINTPLPKGLFGF